MSERTYIEWIVGGIRYAVTGHQLVISRGRTCLAKLNLVPRAEKPVSATKFRREGNTIWAALEGGVEGRAMLTLKDGRVDYTVETSAEHFDKLVYFPESTLVGDLWHTFIWTYWTRPWDLNEDVSIRVGDCRPDWIDPREGSTIDPGDMPPLWQGRGGPRAAAMHHPDYGWWGICIPGPIPACDTYFNARQGKFEILFDYLSPGCEDGFMPSVALAMHLPDPNDPYTTLRTMWELCEPWRLVLVPHEAEARLSAMAQCHLWSALQHQIGNAWMGPIPPAEKGSPFNSEFVLKLLDDLVALEPSVKWHFQLPQGWFKNIGDFAVGDNFGGEEGFRTLADRFRQGGHLLTVHERFHSVNERSRVGQEHPDWVAPLRPRKLRPYWSANVEYEGVAEIMDITREEVREHLKGQVRRFLSDEPGCLNMDGVALTSDHWPSVLDYELANEEYGVGDLLAYKINRELYLCAKAIKPYAWLGMNFPYLPYNTYSFACTMEDDLTLPLNAVIQVQCATNLYPTTQLHIAVYGMTRTKALTLWPLNVAVGIPQVDNPRAFTSPTLDANWIPIDDVYRRRLVSTLAAYANSPHTPDTVNLPAKVEQSALRQEVYAGRLRTEGPLAGFYGALSLGSQTVVTYSEARAVVSSTQGRIVTFPLPPGRNVKAVERVTHDGRVAPHEYSTHDGGDHVEVTLHIEDCGGETKLVQVTY